ncbi:MAG: PKD domain-containing protein [Euryarchaeota archaeon]|nr:PKD domain-containing protein [Euryarchaeota archaeon]
MKLPNMATVATILVLAASVSGGSGWLDEARLTPEGLTTGDLYGRAIALDGDTALIAAHQDDDAGEDAGTVYVYGRTGPTWTLQGRLVPDDARAGHLFGVDLDLDGDIAIVGAPGDDTNGPLSGAVYVFERAGSGWSQTAKLYPDDPSAYAAFGLSVALDGTTALVSAPVLDDHSEAVGAVYAFRSETEGWAQEARLQGDPSRPTFFGLSVALDNGTALIGAPDDPTAGEGAGAGYVFVRDEGGWTHQTTLTGGATPGDTLGVSVAIEADTALVTALGDDGNNKRSGTAYVFTRTGTTWTQETRLMAGDGAQDDRFGYSAALDGDRALIGAYWDDTVAAGTGSTYLFTRTEGTWTEGAMLVADGAASSDWFGVAVALQGPTALVGAHRADVGAKDTGAAYVFTLDTPPTAGFSWSPQQAALASPVDFKDGSSDPDGSIIRWSWDFGDGATSTERHPTHTYTGCGTYLVRLIVTDDDGHQAMTWQWLRVHVVALENGIRMPCPFR